MPLKINQQSIAILYGNASVTFSSFYKDLDLNNSVTEDNRG